MGEKIEEYKVLLGEPGGKRPLGRIKLKWVLRNMARRSG
jgi:hypothetical protein